MIQSRLLTGYLPAPAESRLGCTAVVVVVVSSAAGTGLPLFWCSLVPLCLALDSLLPVALGSSSNSLTDLADDLGQDTGLAAPGSPGSPGSAHQDLESHCHPRSLRLSSHSALSADARSLDSTFIHTNVPGRPKKRTSTHTTPHRTSHCFPSIASASHSPLHTFFQHSHHLHRQRLARTRNDQRFRFRHTTLLPLGPPYVCPLPRLNHLPLWLRPDRTI